ncbi:MAG TPA: sugar phosphate isomerase/epimerase family protein [Chloroflexota bacterium]|nr:sugar phosphate isomerase/epimerase family protein [Chloroflexota bacterium]
MEGIQIACGRITWGRAAPEEQVLAEIARAGYEGTPAGNAAHSAQETLAIYAKYGLKPAPGYLGAAFWDKDQAETIVQQAVLQARTGRALGCTELYVAANLTPERRALSGHVRPDDALSQAGFKQMAETLNRVGEATLKEDVRICFHNHVGSFIETRAEIDQLFALVDRALVFLGPDLGHLAWAGDDAVQLCLDYPTSIKTMHIKDINPAVRAEGVAKGWDYKTFSDHGIFAEIGEGLIDYPAVFEALQKTGFRGWVMVETDVTQKPSAYESAVVSRSYLKGIGV